MGRLVISVILLTFLVDLLLILGTNRMLGCPVALIRSILAALASSVFAGVCLLPHGAILRNSIWRVTILVLMIAVAFGVKGSAIRRGMLFLLLKFALQGAANMLDQDSGASVLVAGGIIGLLFALGLRGSTQAGSLIPVELNYGNRQWLFTALHDTGNTLRDPVTGERVIVAGADMGQKLLGLTQRQLSEPVQTLAAGLAPGMRLIPYRSVGQQGAMMLALRFRDVKVGSWRGSAMVAFAPECFGKREGYQMLIGGMLE